MNSEITRPQKRRELRNHHLDSRIWNHFRFRPTDVVVASYPKSGTTWAQQIVGQLLSAGAEFPINKISQWVDYRAAQQIRLQALEAQKHRRILKSHLPFDALVYSPDAKYIYIARDGRDVVWSFHHIHINYGAAHFRMLNDPPGLVGPPMGPADPDIAAYFRRWLDEDGYPLWSFWDHVRSWWEARNLPNVLLLQFDRLKRDLDGEIRRVGDFLGCDIPPERWPLIVEHCTFDYMKRHAEDVAPLGAAFMQGGRGAFINKGTNGRWRDVLTQEDIARYEAVARERLGEECAEWLAGR